MSILSVDKEGFLRDLADWSHETAMQLAIREGITLNDDHWHVILLVRRYYDDYHISPATRVLVKLLQEDLGTDVGNSIYLMQLFGGKPAKLVSKIAGLPKPANCD